MGDSVSGVSDEAPGSDLAERLGYAPDARLVILSGVNHVLKDAPAERGANIAAYADPNLPLSAAVAPTLLEFVRGLSPAS